MFLSKATPQDLLTKRSQLSVFERQITRTGSSTRPLGTSHPQAATTQGQWCPQNKLSEQMVPEGISIGSITLPDITRREEERVRRFPAT